MLGEMDKKCGGSRFYLSCIYFCTLYFLVKILLVKLKNLNTLACLNLSYGQAKQQPKRWMKVNDGKMAGFINAYDQYPKKFNFGLFSALQ